MKRRRTDRRTRKSMSQLRRSRLERLEDRHLLAVVFADSFEAGGGTEDWAGNWVEDSQDAWSRSSKRATDPGPLESAHSAEVDGWAVDATLTLATPLDLSSYDSAQLTFDWLIESGFGSGEYLALDISVNGGSSWQTDVLRLEGDVDLEDTWHSETVDLTPYLSSNLLIRFRGSMDHQRKDANVDNVQITGIHSSPPEISISDSMVGEQGAIDILVPSGSGGLDSPKGMRLHQDGLLYVVSNQNNSVMRFDPTTGAFVDVFVSSGSGGLANAIDVEFMPGGDLLVASRNTDEVLRYDGTTGAFLGPFVTAGNGGIDGASDLQFGPDGNLYVSGFSSDNILRYDGATGAFLDVFIGDDPETTSIDESGGLEAPAPFIFDSAGNVYVVSFATNQVLKYNANGTFIGEFIAMETGRRPGGIAFGPGGDVYLAEWQGHRVTRHDGTTGERLAVLFDDPLVFKGARSLLFDNMGDLLVSGGATDNIARVGTGPLVTLAYPSEETITVEYTSTIGTAETPGDYFGTSGTLTFAPGETSKRVFLTIVDDTLVEADETLNVLLSNPGGGATIADSQGLITIVDDDAAREVSINSVLEMEGDRRPHYRGGFVQGLVGAHFNPLTFGPDGNIYTAVGTDLGYNTIQRFDGATGKFIDTFMDNSDPNHKINGVRDIVFHPTDGHVYVASAYTDEVLRYDAETGDFVDVFVTAGSGNIDHPDGMAFGPDANGDGFPELYVTGWLSHNVVRYDGVTGVPLGPYVSAGSGGLSHPFSLAFRNDELFVTSANSNQILKYDAGNGNLLGVAASTGLAYPRGLTFGPDDLLYVTSGNNDRILRFMPDGTYVDDYVPAGVAGMQDPRTPRFGPDGDLYVTVTGKNEIMRFGDQNEAVFTVSLSAASNSAVTVSFETSQFGADPATPGADYSEVTGQIIFEPGVTEKRIQVPIIDDVTQETSETFQVSLEVTEGAVLGTGTGAGTIIDDDSKNAPIAADDATIATTEVEQIINVLANDVDPDGDQLTVVSVTPTSGGGTVVINPDNTLSYSSAAGFVGVDSFDYTISDGRGETATATVTIDVAGVEIYLHDIGFESQRVGKGKNRTTEWRAVFFVRSYTPPSTESVAGVAITVTFNGQTYQGTTDADGIFRTPWEVLDSGSYKAELVDLTLAGYLWTGSFDNEDDSDDNDLPDDYLLI